MENKYGCKPGQVRVGNRCIPMKRIGGKLYSGTEAYDYTKEIMNPFIDDREDFEIYECSCGGNFLIESAAAESEDIIYCPYCKNVFYREED